MPQTNIKLNNGSESVSVSLPGWLIEILDEICERKDFTRSTFCKRAIKKAILLNMVDDYHFWERLYHDVQNPPK